MMLPAMRALPYPLEPDNHYRTNINDLATASRRENIRSVIMLAEGHSIHQPEGNMHHETNSSRTPQNALRGR